MDKSAADLLSDLPDLTQLAFAELLMPDVVLAHSVRRVLAEANAEDDAIAGFQSSIS